MFILVQFTNGDISTKSNGHLNFALYKSSNTEDIRKKFRKTLVCSKFMLLEVLTEIYNYVYSSFHLAYLRENGSIK